MQNLTDLVFVGKSQIIAECPLHGCNFNLARLDLEGLPAGFEPMVIEFLRSQPALRHLSLRFSPRASLMPSADLCPQLVSFVGNAQAIKAFLPGRNIVTLIWRPCRDLPIISVDDISAQLNRIEHFAYDFPFGPLGATLVGHLRSVVVLELMGYHPEVSFQLSDFCLTTH